MGVPLSAPRAAHMCACLPGRVLDSTAKGASQSELDQTLSNMRGRFCQVSGGDSCLTAQIREHGVEDHELSGGIDMQSSEPFDELKLP